MATGVTTLLDIAKRTGSDSVVGLIEDATNYAPEFSIIPARPMPGTSYKVTRRTALPTPAFRNANDAITIGKSNYVQDTKSMHFLDCQLQLDEAITKGDESNIGNLMTQEAQGSFQAAVQHVGSQFYYGVGNDAKGFVGALAQSVGKWPAGGTTSTTSAFLIWINPQGAQFVVGNDGSFEMPEWMRQAVNPTSTTQKMVWVTNLSSYIGLQIGSASSVWRVSGIDATNKLTDARGAGLVSKVPLNRRNGLRWFINRTAEYTLRQSRAVAGYIAATSAGSPTQEIAGNRVFSGDLEPLAGVPITVTDSLVDTETNVGTADTYATE